MIIFYEGMSQDVINNIIENEKSEVSNKLKMFDSYRKTLLLYAHKIVDDLKKIQLENASQEVLTISTNLTNLLKKTREIQNLFTEVLKKLENILISKDSIEVTEYNSDIEQLQNDCNTFITEFEALTQDCLKVIEFSYSEPPVLEKTNKENETIEEKTPISQNISDNNCLLISEKQSKVFLPYTIKKLEEQLANSSEKYSSIDELIQQEYILPLERFKNPVLSRFRETYVLMREKENSSFIDSVNFAIELSLNSTLNPAVIAACQNKDELDIYLDCLYEKELDQFKIFDIIYEINPQIK